MTYSDTKLDQFDQIFDNAAWGIENEDQFFEFVLLMDPDGSIEAAIGDRRYAEDQARRAALSEAELAAEDAHNKRMVERALVRMRQVMAEKAASRDNR